MEAVNFPFAIGEEEAADNGLVKYEFHYQLHERIQWGNMLCLVLAGLFTLFLRVRFSVSLWQCLERMLIVSVGLLSLFSLTHGLGIFRGVGHCWRDGETVVIECGEKEYRIASVKELIGGDRRFFFAKFSTLSITTDRDIFEIFSLPLHTDEQFEQSSVEPLCEFVLGSFPYLQAVQPDGENTKRHYVRIDR
jgi:hypothetical protein